MDCAVTSPIGDINDADSHCALPPKAVSFASHPISPAPATADVDIIRASTLRTNVCAEPIEIRFEELSCTLQEKDWRGKVQHEQRILKVR
jgi:hypothetical protein